MIKKLSFKEKNRHLHLLKDESMFDKDYALFKEHCSHSKLHNELARITRFNKASLYERMLFELLDFADVEKIKQNREDKEATPFFDDAEEALYYVHAYFDIDEDGTPLLISDIQKAALLTCTTEEEARAICIEIAKELVQAYPVNNIGDSIQEDSSASEDNSANINSNISTQEGEATNKPQDTIVEEKKEAVIEKPIERVSKSKPSGKATNVTPPKKKRNKARR